MEERCAKLEKLVARIGREIDRAEQREKMRKLNAESSASSNPPAAQTLIRVPTAIDTLYVYSKLPPCIGQHPTVSVTVYVACAPNMVYPINAYYCGTCCKSFVSASELERYLQQYHTIPMRIVKLMDGPENTDGYFQRREISDLKLSGYTVAANAGLSDKDRQELLARLMDNGSFTKGEIVRHLSMLIETNGARASMATARKKWAVDKAFVMNYRIHEQPKATVEKVKSGSKYIGVQKK